MRIARKLTLMPLAAGLAFAGLFLVNAASRERDARLMARIRTELVPGAESGRLEPARPRRAEMAAALEEAAAQQRRSAARMDVAIALCALVLACVSAGVIGSTTGGLRRAVAVAESLSRGDLSSVPSPGTRDEVGRLLTSLQRMSLYLRETAVMADRIGGTDPAPCGAQGVPGNAFSKIAEAEARHRHLLASVQAIVWRADVASLRFLFVSPGAEKILGHPSRLWIEDPSFWTSHLHPRDRERAQLAHLRAAERGEDQEVEYRMLAADGRTVWLQGSVRRVVSGDAGPELVGVLVDVTEHKRAKQALEQSERQLAEAQRLAHVGSWEWDVVANRLTWSEELCRIFGREGRAPARYEGSLRLVHPEDRTAVEAAVQAALDQGRAFALDHRIVRPDGSVRTIHSLGRVDLDESGKPSRLVGAAQDVTEARAAAVARIESEARYRRLLANIPDVAWTSASDGTTAFISAKVEALYGFTAEEIRADPALWLGRIHPEDLDYVAKAFHALFDKGEPFDQQYRIQKKDGSWMWVHDRALNTYERGGLRYVDGIFSDITERKQLEEQLRQAQKMEAVGRLAGGVAHDFNNILSVIMGYGAMLKRRQTDDLGKKQVDQILRASERAAALTGQLLAFGRKQVLQPKVLDLNTVVAEMDPMLRRLIGEDIRLVVSPQIHLARVKADPGQMEQVLMNLAVNARDAMPGGGTLVIETRNVQLDAAYARGQRDAQTGPHVLLAVSDTGHGIDAETQGHIFEPFFTTKERGKGTGLGLATVYGIVKQSGGHVAVYSEVGKGSTFKVYLPPVADALDAPRPRASTAPQPGTETILLVEDEDSIRSMIRELLEGAGYAVLEGPTPAQALALAASHAGRIDLAVTDVVMPGMSGPQMAQRLAASRPEAKVLYMSGYTDDAIGQHGLLDAGTHFIHKPFAMDAFLAKLRHVLAGQAAASPAAAPAAPRASESAAS